MAEVHLARQRGPRQFEKIVVVKTVRAALASRPELATMLLEEARIAALVKHPNVVDIYDLGEEHGTFFIAMEYLEGESLSAILKVSRGGKRLDPFSTARIIGDCAAGLHAAHELRSLAGEPLELVHQDVTPGNVIVLYTGQVKLVDFGVAKVRTSADDGMVKGKTGYLAPEVIDGAPADRRSDIWSLGVVLWEALTLRRLFAGKSEEEQIARIRTAEVPAPSTLMSTVPRDLDEIVFNALARDPSKRYRTAQSMQSDLMQIVRHASWSGGHEPIARFMRSTFVDRISARRELLRELAMRPSPRSTTVERLQALRDDAAPVEPERGIVIGAHGTAPAPSAIALPGVTEPVMTVEISEIEEPAPVATPVPTVRMATLRRRVTAAALIIGALVGTVVAAVAVGSGDSQAAGEAPDGGVVLAAVEAIAVDAAVAPVDAAAVVARDGVDGDDDVGEEVVAAPVARTERRRSARRSERVAAAPVEEPRREPAPSKSVTAKSLYKDGLQAFVAGDTGAAVALFERAKKKEPGYAPTYRGLGMAYERRGDKRKARKAFETYLRLAPSASDAAQIRARLERLP